METETKSRVGASPAHRTFLFCDLLSQLLRCINEYYVTDKQIPGGVLSQPTVNASSIRTDPSGPASGRENVNSATSGVDIPCQRQGMKSKSPGQTLNHNRDERTAYLALLLGLDTSPPSQIHNGGLPAPIGGNSTEHTHTFGDGDGNHGISYDEETSTKRLWHLPRETSVSHLSLNFQSPFRQSNTTSSTESSLSHNPSLGGGVHCHPQTAMPPNCRPDSDVYHQGGVVQPACYPIRTSVERLPLQYLSPQYSRCHRGAVTRWPFSLRHSPRNSDQEPSQPVRGVLSRCQSRACQRHQPRPTAPTYCPGIGSPTDLPSYYQPPRRSYHDGYGILPAYCPSSKPTTSIRGFPSQQYQARRHPNHLAAIRSCPGVVTTERQPILRSHQQTEAVRPIVPSRGTLTSSHYQEGSFGTPRNLRGGFAHTQTHLFDSTTAIRHPIQFQSPKRQVISSHMYPFDHLLRATAKPESPNPQHHQPLFNIFNVVAGMGDCVISGH